MRSVPSILAIRVLRFRRNIVLAVVGWTVLLGVLTFLGVRDDVLQTRDLAAREGRAHLNLDFALRHWAARHGGVYVPPTEHTPPNPYLSHLPERDIVTPSGQPLTLMNPAYMIRQVMEDYSHDYGVYGRITSLKPLNPRNAPDPWETAALQRIERGETQEISEMVDTPVGPQLRMIRAMVTEADCLKCHSHQGYKIGDIRGGLVVSLPLDELYAIERQNIQRRIGTMGGIWFLGMIGLGSVYVRGRERIRDEVDEQDRINTLSRQNELILASVGGGIIGVDVHCHITFCNPGARDMLGYEETQLLGMPFHTLIHDHQRGMDFRCLSHCGVCETLTEGQNAHSAGMRLIRFDQTLCPVEIFSSPLMEDGGITGAVIVFRDITDRLESERNSAELMVRLSRSNRDLQDFAYVVSHDLQEPLRMISSYVDLIRRRYTDKLDQDGQDFVAFAVDGAKRMSHMISDLVQFSRVESRGAQFETVNMSQAVQACLDNLSLAIADSGADVLIDGVLPNAQGDTAQIIRVWQNLLGNAIKFRHPDRPAKIVLRGHRRDDGRVEFSVQDNGIGIAERDQSRVFMIFQRACNRETYQGTGIGLAVVKRIVERHGGEVVLTSQEGVGSTFTFDLPGC